MKARMKMALSAATLLGTCWPRAEASAQNLVPNGSFEEYTECPWGVNQLSFAVGWDAWHNSPDYFHACSEVYWTDVPQNFIAYQPAAHGVAYCGVLGFIGGGGDYAEVIGAELDEPLAVGVPVYVSFRIAAAVGGTTINARRTCDRIGVLFCTEIQGWTDEFPFPNRSHLEIAEPLSTPGQWTTVSGYFIPDSAYGFVSLGRMFELDSTSMVVINPGGNSPDAYFVVDEVCVAYDPLDCDFAQAVNIQPSEAVSAVPNPFEQGFWLNLPLIEGTKFQVRISDLAGGVLQTVDDVTLDRLFVDGRQLPTGLLVLAVSSSSKTYAPLRIVHVSP